MNDHYLQIRKILFKGPTEQASLNFNYGINVICGASDTGKSFLAESIDFMLGGSELSEIPELAPYTEIEFHLFTSNENNWCLQRSITGGNFRLTDLNDNNPTETILKHDHNHGTVDNLSGFLLEEIGLLNRRILRSSKKLTTQSLSFRNLARLIVIQEDEIHQKKSPFWSGQFVTKTPDTATLKLLLTGVDDSAIVSPPVLPDNNQDQIAVLDELILEIAAEIDNIEENKEQLYLQLEKLENTIKKQDASLDLLQFQLNTSVQERYEIFEIKNKFTKRLTEISELLARFELLREHYIVDIERLKSIQESGSLFFHIEVVPCPICGSDPEAQHLNDTCNTQIEKIVNSATSEIIKTNQFLKELNETVQDLYTEEKNLLSLLEEAETKYKELDQLIQHTIVPQVGNFRTSFSQLIEKRSNIHKNLELFSRYDRLDERKRILLENINTPREKSEVKTDIPEAVANELSMKLSTILKDWKFPGECQVHFDKKSVDFVIDGKPRRSSGKGLRAITHAATSVALLEYCQENELPHPGFLVLDSPLLAYYEPEGEDDIALSGTDLKEMFYTYLVEHHGTNSQIIIIENQHPPVNIQGQISLTVFTKNPNEGRFGLL